MEVIRPDIAGLMGAYGAALYGLRQSSKAHRTASGMMSQQEPVSYTHLLEAELPHLDVLYMTRIQQERFFNEEEYLRLKGCYLSLIHILSTAEVNYPSAHRSRWLTLAREWLDDTFDFHLGTGETGG